MFNWINSVQKCLVPKQVLCMLEVKLGRLFSVLVKKKQKKNNGQWFK